MLSVQVNGEPQEIPEGTTLDMLLAQLNLAADRVAVERNHAIVPRDQWNATKLEPGDRLEIVHFVGGG